VNKKDLSIELINRPNVADISQPADVLKVIEFYARA
jgi:hypothetical protein